MAIFRPPMLCPHCGAANYFIPNPMTPKQLLEHWVGDNGGRWPDVCKKCGKPLISLEGLHYPPEMLKNNIKPDEAK